MLREELLLLDFAIGVLVEELERKLEGLFIHHLRKRIIRKKMVGYFNIIIIIIIIIIIPLMIKAQFQKYILSKRWFLCVIISPWNKWRKVLNNGSNNDNNNMYYIWHNIAEFRSTWIICI